MSQPPQRLIRRSSMTHHGNSAWRDVESLLKTLARRGSRSLGARVRVKLDVRRTVLHRPNRQQRARRERTYASAGVFSDARSNASLVVQAKTRGLVVLPDRGL